jgi:hypothetical protein
MRDNLSRAPAPSGRQLPITQDPRQPRLIVTVRGHGYKFTG